MNIGLFSGPASKVSADLLVFLVDAKETMHVIDDPAIAAVVEEAASRVAARSESGSARASTRAASHLAARGQQPVLLEAPDPLAKAVLGIEVFVEAGLAQLHGAASPDRRSRLGGECLRLRRRADR